MTASNCFDPSALLDAGADSATASNSTEAALSIAVPTVGSSFRLWLRPSSINRKRNHYESSYESCLLVIAQQAFLILAFRVR